MGNGSFEITYQTARVKLPFRRGRELPQAIATLKTGTTVLDLGSGDEAYSFLAATTVGKSGCVIGVEATPALLDQARANASALPQPHNPLSQLLKIYLTSDTSTRNFQASS